MMHAMIFWALAFFSFAIAAPAAAIIDPAPTTATNDSAPAAPTADSATTSTPGTSLAMRYPLICNGNNIDFVEIADVSDMILGHPANDIIILLPDTSLHWLEACPPPNIKTDCARLSLRSLDNNGATATVADIRNGFAQIWGACGNRGGSNAAFGNGNFIVHLNKEWT